MGVLPHEDSHHLVAAGLQDPLHGQGLGHVTPPLSLDEKGHPQGGISASPVGHERKATPPPRAAPKESGPAFRIPPDLGTIVSWVSQVETLDRGDEGVDEPVHPMGPMRPAFSPIGRSSGDPTPFDWAWGSTFPWELPGRRKSRAGRGYEGMEPSGWMVTVRLAVPAFSDEITTVTLTGRVASIASSAQDTSST